LVLYDDCGHMPMEELPAETARDAHAFLVKGAAPKKGGKARKKAGAVKKGKRK